jgi:hypothetical protein
MAEYDIVKIDADTATNFGAELRGNPLEVVYKRVNGRYEPWVVVGTSALLAGLGISGRGVYAARTFRGPSDRGLVRRRGDMLGNYKEAAAMIARGDDSHVKERGSFWVERGKDKLIIVEDGNDYVLLDGDISPGSVSAPWALVNDCRNTGRQQNATMDPNGTLRVRRNVSSVDWNAPNLASWASSAPTADRTAIAIALAITAAKVPRSTF